MYFYKSTWIFLPTFSIPILFLHSYFISKSVESADSFHYFCIASFSSLPPSLPLFPLLLLLHLFLLFLSLCTYPFLHPFFFPLSFPFFFSFFFSQLILLNLICENSLMSKLNVHFSTLQSICFSQSSFQETLYFSFFPRLLRC